MLGEFGNSPNRYADAKSRKNYASASPVTKASGRSKGVLARHSRYKRLADALDQWSFSSPQKSPRARAYYNELRTRQKSRRKAERQVPNRGGSAFCALVSNGVVSTDGLAEGARSRRLTFTRKRCLYVLKVTALPSKCHGQTSLRRVSTATLNNEL